MDSEFVHQTSKSALDGAIEMGNHFSGSKRTLA
jgi:hypothetical protein